MLMSYDRESEFHKGNERGQRPINSFLINLHSNIDKNEKHWPFRLLGYRWL